MNSDKRNQMIYHLNLKLKIFYMLSAISDCKLHFIECIVKRSVLPNISQFEDVYMKNLKHRNKHIKVTAMRLKSTINSEIVMKI